MILSDVSIRELISDGKMVIEPFSESVREVDGVKVISYGLGVSSYDVRLAPVWEVFKRDLPQGFIIDPKFGNAEAITEKFEGEIHYLQPGEYALAHTLEHFELPTNVMGLFMAKSTYARSGLIFNTTPVQPGFKGQVVMEFYNPTAFPITLRANEGFAQLELRWLDREPSTDYGKLGRYQGQSGVQHSRV